MAEQQRSLVKKLCKVMAEVGHIPKRGRNDFHRYDYVQEADLVDAIRDKLAEQNVFLFSNVEDMTAQEKTTAKGAITAVTTARVSFTFVDGDSGEERTFSYFGQGEDPADKGGYKAFTGAVKYALMKTFLVPTGDDPEADGETDRRNAGGSRQNGKPQQSAPKPQAAPVTTPSSPPPAQQASSQPRSNGKSSGGGSLTDGQIRRLFAIAKGARMDKDQIDYHIEQTYGLGSITDLNREQYDEVCNMMIERQKMAGVNN